MKAALAQGANFWNGGELYGPPDANSLQLLQAYFKAYPEDASKVVLSIKGGLIPGQMVPDGSEKNVQRSIDECLQWLQEEKHLDLFECARMDPNVPYETSVGQIAKNVKDGKVGGISLSEVDAETIRKVAKLHKVAAVEVELSLFTTDILHNGVAAACAELDIPVIAYSPLSRGLLSGTFSSADDVPARLSMMSPRFRGEALQENLKLVKEVERLAAAKGCTMAQIAIAWVRSMSGRNGLPVIIPIPGATTEKRVNENMKDITLSEDEMTEIDKMLERIQVQGERYG